MISKWKREYDIGDVRQREFFTLVPRCETVTLDGNTYYRWLWMERIRITQKLEPTYPDLYPRWRTVHIESVK